MTRATFTPQEEEEIGSVVQIDVLPGAKVNVPEGGGWAKYQVVALFYFVGDGTTWLEAVDNFGQTHRIGKPYEDGKPSLVWPYFNGITP